MNHISKPISALVDRGDLPERLEVTRTIGPHRTGDVLTWIPALSGYQGRTGWMMLAGIARGHYGKSLIQAKPIHTQQPLFAA
jgi:hypothetical protein